MFQDLDGRQVVGRFRRRRDHGLGTAASIRRSPGQGSLPALDPRASISRLGEWCDLRGHGPVHRLGRRRGELVGGRERREADLRLPAGQTAGDLRPGRGARG